MNESGKTENITLEWALERIKGLEQRLVGSEEVRRIAVRELGKERQENKRLRDGLEKKASSTRLVDIHGSNCGICNEARIAQQVLKENSKDWRDEMIQDQGLPTEQEDK